MADKSKKPDFTEEAGAGALNFKSAPPPAKFTKEEELQAYRQMLLLRKFEEKAGQLYGKGEIGGFCHLYIGQEAVITGVKKVSREGDQFITSYRDHAHALINGVPARAVMAELTGREGGMSKGKGGSMHMFSKEHHFYGGHGIVGAEVPLGTGLAFANFYRGNNAVSLTFYGDGASNQGQVYEAYNIAAHRKLPIVYIIENNRYAMGTSVIRHSGETDLSRRGLSCGIPGMSVDGMDVRAVAAAAEEAIAWARSGKGPFLLNMETYRYRGHSMSDPAKYRPREEMEEIRDKRDPIDQVKKRVLQEKIAEEAELKAIESEVRAEVADAADFAEKSPLPAEAELWTDILI